MFIVPLGLIVAVGIFDFLAEQSSGGPGRGERLGRGIVALRRADGDVFLSWRLLADDPDRTFFHVFRRPAGGGDDEWLPMTAIPIRHGTNFLDETAHADEGYDYQLQPLLGGVEGPFEAHTTIPAGPGKPYLAIPIEGEGEVISLLPGDLDGDGEYELVLRREEALEAYRLDGTLLWHRDLAAGAAYTVFDLDGDGKAEVYLADPAVALSGESGEVARTMPWEGEAPALYVAYLAGGEPHILAQTLTAEGARIVAYDAAGEQLWSAAVEQPVGPGIAADVDGDGFDEIVLGPVTLDHDGTVLWTHEGEVEGRPQVACVLAEGEGLQIAAGSALLDAASGEEIWAMTEGGAQVGFVADVSGDEAGMQVLRDETAIGTRKLVSAEGHEIEADVSGWPPDMMAAYWDGMEQKSLVDPRAMRILRFPDEELGRLDDGAEGKARIIAVLDLLGDWREEIVVAVPGELRIYTTTMPSPERRVTLMQDRLYRTGAARTGTEQGSQPQESGEQLKPPGPLFGW